jgi:hypothetical protein
MEAVMVRSPGAQAIQKEPSELGGAGTVGRVSALILYLLRANRSPTSDTIAPFGATAQAKIGSPRLDSHS